MKLQKQSVAHRNYYTQILGHDERFIRFRPDLSSHLIFLLSAAQQKPPSPLGVELEIPLPVKGI